MSDTSLSDLAVECRRLASTLRERCATVGAVDDEARTTLACEIASAVMDLGWIVGRNYGAETVAAEVALAATLVRQPAMVLDVGANAGHWSRAALTAFPGARVMAFEPQRAHVASLTTLQSSFPERFEFRNVAISDKGGKIPLYANEEGSGLASVYKRDLKRFYNLDMRSTGKVTTSTLAKEMKRLSLDEVSILKIDVEGHELSVLRSAGEQITNCKYIQFEFGGAMMDAKVTFRDFMTFFAELPFSIFRIAPVGLIALPFYDESLEGYQMSNYAAVHNSLL